MQFYWRNILNFICLHFPQRKWRSIFLWATFCVLWELIAGYYQLSWGEIPCKEYKSYSVCLIELFWEPTSSFKKATLHKCQLRAMLANQHIKFQSHRSPTFSRRDQSIFRRENINFSPGYENAPHGSEIRSTGQSLSYDYAVVFSPKNRLLLNCFLLLYGFTLASHLSTFFAVLPPPPPCAWKNRLIF